MNISYEELAHVVMGTENSHNLPSVSWRPRKACGVIQGKYKGTRTRGDDGVKPSNNRAGKDDVGCDVSAHTVKQKKMGQSLPSFLCLFSSIFGTQRIR